MAVIFKVCHDSDLKTVTDRGMAVRWPCSWHLSGAVDLSILYIKFVIKPEYAHRVLPRLLRSMPVVRYERSSVLEQRNA